jgi:hypothetical protein
MPCVSRGSAFGHLSTGFAVRDSAPSPCESGRLVLSFSFIFPAIVPLIRHRHRL